jgi:hypothetical protein
MRAWLACCVLAGCGNATTAPRHVEREHVRVDAGAIVIDAAVEAGPDKLAMLVARRDRMAPGTREIAQREIDLGATKKEDSLALDTFAVDTCIRAAFDSDAPTAITLASSSGMTLGSADGTEGAIGAAGPVCFRKGDAATFHFNGESRLRIVVWASP